MSSGPNSPQHLPLTLSLKCQWCFRGRTQNQKCSRRLWRNSVGEKKEKNSKKPVSRQERRQQQQQLITSSCNTRPPLVVLPWRPAGGRPMAWPPSNTVRSGVFQGQEVTCSRSVYQNNPLCKWIIGWNTGAYRTTWMCALGEFYSRSCRVLPEGRTRWPWGLIPWRRRW